MTKRDKIIDIIAKTMYHTNTPMPKECDCAICECVRDTADKILELDKESVCSCEDKYQDPLYAKKSKDCPIHGEKKVEKLEYKFIDDTLTLSKAEMIIILNIKDCMNAINKINERINGEG